jgi:hypothetical protein
MLRYNLDDAVITSAERTIKVKDFLKAALGA